MNNKLKKILWITFLAVLIPVLIVITINLHMINYSAKYIEEDITTLNEVMDSPAQTVIVFGAYVYDSGQPCPMLEDRILTGLEVFNSEIVDKVLLSGDHGTRGYDEVNSMKNYTFKQGLEQCDIFLDHAGFSTYDSIIRARDVFKVESAVLSTQNYHLTRAVYIARKSGIDAYGVKADLRNYPKREMARYLLREWLARIKDFFYVNVFKPDPVYLGDEIPITGDSYASYDKPEDLK